MATLDDIVGWIQHYDVAIKIVTAVAVPGGIWFWIDKYRNRIRIKVRRFELPARDTSVRGIAFECENISGSLTSLEPTFTLTGYTPERGRQTYTFTIDGNDRQLPPHVPKQVLGFHNDRENRIILLLWYMAFTVSLTKGAPIRLRYRNAECVRLGFFRFHWERLRYVWLGKMPSK